MAYEYIDNQIDPFDNDAEYPYHVQTSYYSGSSEQIIVPGAANFPESSPTRYFFYFPYIIDVSDLTGSYPCSLYDSTSGIGLTRVTGSPAANQYRIVTDEDSNGRCIIEFHSTQDSHTIDYDLYILGSVLVSDQFNDIDIQGGITIGDGEYIATSNDSDLMQLNGNLGVEINGYVLASSYGNFGGGTKRGSDGTILKEKIIDIGDWNMDADATTTVAHGLGSSFIKIRDIKVMIRNDGGTGLIPLDTMVTSTYANAGGVYNIDSTNITLYRKADSSANHGFDDALFDSTSYNRGWIYILYEI